MSKRNSSAVARLKQDYIRLKKVLQDKSSRGPAFYHYPLLYQDPVPYIVAEPLPSNILEWRYVVTGPEDSLYRGGLYHGKLVFPSEFPFKPPSIFMITPNGRFKTDTRLCLSISDYHPDTWNPAWSVSTILTGERRLHECHPHNQDHLYRPFKFHAGEKSNSWVHRDE